MGNKREEDITVSESNLTNFKIRLEDGTHYITRKEHDMIYNSIHGVRNPFRKLTKDDANFELNRAIKEIIGDTFIFMKFNNVIELDGKYQFRLMYLMTYCCFRSANNKENYININNYRIKKKHLKEIFTDIQQRDYERMIKYFIDNKVILEDVRGYIYISSRYCKRGSIGQKYDNNRRVDGMIRSFDNFVRELYNTIPKKDHKKLSYLVMCIPYIHITKNYIVEKEDVDKPLRECRALSLNQLADRLGMSNNSDRLKKAIFSIKIDGEYVIGRFKTGVGEDERERLVVNPKFLLKSIEIQSIYETNRLFEDDKEMRNE